MAHNVPQTKLVYALRVVGQAAGLYARKGQLRGIAKVKTYTCSPATMAHNSPAKSLGFLAGTALA